MNNKKRIQLVAALSVLLVVLLIGAGLLVYEGVLAGPKIGICFRQLSDGSTQAYKSQLESMLAYSGFNTTVADAQNDQSKQDEQVRKMLRSGCDLLVVEPVISGAADVVAALAKEADIPLIFINREPEQEVLESWEKICFVGSITSHAGTVQGQIAAALPQMGDINGDGQVSYVMLLGDPALIDTQQRSESCIAAMTEAGAQLTCLESVVTDGTKAGSEFRCAQLLAKYGKDIEIIFCNTDEIAMGALEAVKSGGWEPGADVHLLGMGGSSDALAMVQEGQLSGTVIRDTAGLCDKVRSVAVQMLAESHFQKIHYVDFLPVTPPGEQEDITV